MPCTPPGSKTTYHHLQNGQASGILPPCYECSRVRHKVLLSTKYEGLFSVWRLHVWGSTYHFVYSHCCLLNSASPQQDTLTSGNHYVDMLWSFLKLIWSMFWDANWLHVAAFRYVYVLHWFKCLVITYSFQGCCKHFPMFDMSPTMP